MLFGRPFIFSVRRKIHLSQFPAKTIWILFSAVCRAITHLPCDTESVPRSFGSGYPHPSVSRTESRYLVRHSAIRLSMLSLFWRKGSPAPPVHGNRKAADHAEHNQTWSGFSLAAPGDLWYTFSAPRKNRPCRNPIFSSGGTAI